MGIADKLDEWLRETDLEEQELLDLGSIYGIIRSDHKDLMDLAIAHDMTIAQAYWECRRAQRLIAERIKKMRGDKAAHVDRQEMP